jgi:hypothetical protein
MVSGWRASAGDQPVTRKLSLRRSLSLAQSFERRPGRVGPVQTFGDDAFQALALKQPDDITGVTVQRRWDKPAGAAGGQQAAQQLAALRVGQLADREPVEVQHIKGDERCRRAGGTVDTRAKRVKVRLAVSTQADQLPIDNDAAP